MGSSGFGFVLKWRHHRTKTNKCNIKETAKSGKLK
jgi:hypothetical protein